MYKKISIDNHHRNKDSNHVHKTELALPAGEQKIARSKIIKAVLAYQTPLYIYDAGVLQQQYQTLAHLLQPYAEIFYSMKANPNLSICRLFKKMGAGLEICSLFELKAAMKLAFPRKSIIFVGPAKTDDEIRLCLTYGIYAIVCESFREYERIARIATELGIEAHVALRINPIFSSKTALLKMGGKPSQFGIDEELVFNNIKFFQQFPVIKLIGLHVYNGTRILDAETIYENTKEIVQLARRFEKAFSMSLSMLDIGGGLGIPYYEGENPIDLTRLHTLIIPELKQFIDDHIDTRLILESGRFLMGYTGAFVAQVVDVKPSKGELFIITDGGMNCHMAASGMNTLMRKNFPIRLISMTSSSKRKNSSETKKTHHPIEILVNEALVYSETTAKLKYQITGPLCTPGDVIGKDVLLPLVNIGDLIVIDHSGAYGPTASPVSFLSHGFPAEILIDQNLIQLIRKHDAADDIFRNQ